MTKRWQRAAGGALVLAVALVPDAALAEGPAPAAQAKEDATVRAELATAERHLQSLDATSLLVQTLLRGARGARDAERAGCLDELLSRVHVAARYGRSLRDAIEAALRRGDAEGARIEMGRLGHLGERGARLLGQATRCGSSATVAVTRGTEVKVRVPTLPDAAAYPRVAAGK